MSEFNTIEAATRLFELKEKSNNCYHGLLYPNGSSPFSYGRPALSLEIKIKPIIETTESFEFFARIRSIDDSGVSIFGPTETYEKALARVKKFIEFIKDLEYKCPLEKELIEKCKEIGVFPDYW